MMIEQERRRDRDTPRRVSYQFLPAVMITMTCILLTAAKNDRHKESMEKSESNHVSHKSVL